MKKVEKLFLEVEGEFEDSEKAQTAFRDLLVLLKRRGFTSRSMRSCEIYKQSEELCNSQQLMGKPPGEQATSNY